MAATIAGNNFTYEWLSLPLKSVKKKKKKCMKTLITDMVGMEVTNTQHTALIELCEKILKRRPAQSERVQSWVSNSMSCDFDLRLSFNTLLDENVFC